MSNPALDCPHTGALHVTVCMVVDSPHTQIQSRLDWNWTGDTSENMSHEVNLGNLFGGWKRQNKKKDNDWSKLSSSFFLVWRVPLWLAYVLSSAGQVGIICWFYAENLPILCQKFAHFTVLQRMKIPDRVRSWRIECLQNSLFYCQNGYWFLFLSSWSLNPIHMPLFFIFDVIIFKFSIWNLPDPSCNKTEIYICCFISRCASLHAPHFEVSKPIKAKPASCVLKRSLSMVPHV